MKIETIRPMDNVQNMYVVVVDGVEMTIATRPDQNPVEVINDFFAEHELTYAEKRLQEYPSLNDQLDMIYHDIDAWREKIAEIKARHPKSGGE